jgi:hypothetical protein
VSGVSQAVREALLRERERERRRQELLRQATELRFAWAKGITTLYKLRSLDPGSRAFTLDTIKNSRVHFSSPEVFNDPFDCAPPIELAGSIDDPEFRKELEDDERRSMDEAGLTQAERDSLRAQEGVPIERLAESARAHTLSALRASARIFCLAAEHRHPLMWSHYASSHTGICLHFRCDAGNVFGLAREVLYQPERKPLLIPLSRHQSADEVTEQLVFAKADFWHYESEYRIIAHRDSDWGYTFEEHDLVSFPPELLVGVTLGMSIRAPDRDEVIALAAARDPPVPVSVAVQDPQRFWMDIKPLPS